MYFQLCRARHAGLAVVAVLLAAGHGAAQQSRPTSLDIVPQSASFYWASMNHQAQYDAVVNSNAYQRLLDTNIAQNMRKAYRSGRRRGFEQFGYGNPFGQYLQGYSETIGSVPGKMAMTFLKEIFRNEVFIYADDDWNEMSDAVSKTYLRIVAEVLSPGGDFADLDDEELERLLPILRDELQGVNTPTLVIGTVLDEPARIESLLQMAEAGIEQLMLQFPPNMEYVADAYRVVEEDDAYLLTLNLSDEMIPWQELESDAFFQEHEEELKAILAGKSISIVFGIKGPYFVFSVGPSPDHITSLGQGALLIDHEKTRPLKAVRNESLTGVTYVSQAVMQRSRDMGGLVDYLVHGLEFASAGNGEALLSRVKADAAELKADLEQLTPRSGSYLAFSHLNEQGVAGYVYDWTENQFLDSSQPLTILQRVGSHPAFVVAARDNGSIEQYAVVRKWCAKVFDYMAEFVPEFVENDHQAALFRDIMADLRPIFKKVDSATGQDLLPATANGQFAMLLDFSSRKSAWQAAMPESETPVPLPALAIVLQIHDVEKIKNAGAAYLQSAQELLELIRSIPDSEVPDELQIVPPQVRTMGDAEVFFYEIPDEAGLDESISPHAVLSSQWLLLSYSTDQSMRLMSDTGPNFSGPLREDRPLMAAMYYDNTQVIDALYDWFKYGVQVAREDGLDLDMQGDAENELLTFSEEDLLEGLDRVIDLLKCFQVMESASYMQDGAQVTEFQMFFADVQPDQ